MKRSACWATVLSLCACAVFYGLDIYAIEIAKRSASPMLAPEHGTLFFLAMVLFIALGLMAVGLPRTAGLLGIGGYLVVLVLMLVLVGDRARNYNAQHGLQFGDPGRQMPLKLVTEMKMWHVVRLGLPILALSAALARASKIRDEQRSSSPAFA